MVGFFIFFSSAFTEGLTVAHNEKMNFKVVNVVWKRKALVRTNQQQPPFSGHPLLMGQ